MPQAYIDNGDPYRAHCIETMRLLRQRLDYDEATLPIVFQSRFGRDKWLEPATIEAVAALAKRGVKNIAVITPGFSADCLELWKRSRWRTRMSSGSTGKNFAAIACLNDSAAGMEVIRHLALRELKAGPEQRRSDPTQPVRQRRHAGDHGN